MFKVEGWRVDEKCPLVDDEIKAGGEKTASFPDIIDQSITEGTLMQGKILD